MTKFQIGDTVTGPDGERGTVMDPEFGDAVPHAPDAVWVAWEDGVSTWTPPRQITLAE